MVYVYGGFRYRDTVELYNELDREFEITEEELNELDRELLYADGEYAVTFTTAAGDYIEIFVEDVDEN